MKSSKPNSSVKRTGPPHLNWNDNLSEIALAAIVSSRKQKEISEFINFLLRSLERNSTWLNTVLDRQPYFRCAFMLGAGPNRFQIKDVIYPSEDQNIKLQIALRDSPDLNKIAVAALFKLNNAEIQKIMEFVKIKLYDNLVLKDDLLQGKSMGVQYALLRQMENKQYRVAERIVIGTSIRAILPAHLRVDSANANIRKPRPKKIKPKIPKTAVQKRGLVH